MNSQLVSVICLCYNQARFIEEAVQSVLMQTHQTIQLIIVDDASTDNSPEMIGKIVSANPRIEYLLLKENLGNCAAFNRGLALVKGDFIIDLAADDILLPERVAAGVKILVRYFCSRLIRSRSSPVNSNLVRKFISESTEKQSELTGVYWESQRATSTL